MTISAFQARSHFSTAGGACIQGAGPHAAVSGLRLRYRALRCVLSFIIAVLSHLEWSATLQDENCLYFVQQFVHGGDLFSLLYSERLSTTKLGGLPPQQAAFYLANVLVILEFLHEQDVVFRDMKPENLVCYVFCI